MHTRKQVVGYARVSVDAPDKVSPEIQAEAIEQFCKLKDWELVDTIIERGRSAGEGKKRPGLDRARKMIRAGKASGLVVWKIDRCSRSVRDFSEILSELQKLRADFVSVTESFDTSSAMGVAMLQITMVFAQLERARMGERTVAWQAWRARQGKQPTGRAALGYELVDGEWVIDEDTAPIVKQAVNVFLETGSQMAAFRYMHEAGQPRWHTGIRRLLTSPTIAGMREVDGVLIPGDWPAIIDIDTHRQVVDKLNGTLDPRSNRVHRTDQWLLTGIAVCGREECGQPLTAGQVSPPPARYRCSRVIKPHLDTPPCALGIRRDELDAHVEKRLLKRIDKQMWRRMRATRLAEPAPPVVDVAALDAKRAELVDDYYMRHFITRTEFEAALTALTTQLEAAEIEAAESVEDRLDLPDVDNLHQAWPSMPVNAKRLVVTAVIDRIVVPPTVRVGARPKSMTVDDLLKERGVDILWRKPQIGDHPRIGQPPL